MGKQKEKNQTTAKYFGVNKEIIMNIRCTLLTILLLLFASNITGTHPAIIRDIRADIENNNDGVLQEKLNALRYEWIGAINALILGVATAHQEYQNIISQHSYPAAQENNTTETISMYNHIVDNINHSAPKYITNYEPVPTIEHIPNNIKEQFFKLKNLFNELGKISLQTMIYSSAINIIRSTADESSSDSNEPVDTTDLVIGMIYTTIDSLRLFKEKIRHLPGHMLYDLLDKTIAEYDTQNLEHTVGAQLLFNALDDSRMTPDGMRHLLETAHRNNIIDQETYHARIAAIPTTPRTPENPEPPHDDNPPENDNPQIPTINTGMTTMQKVMVISGAGLVITGLVCAYNKWVNKKKKTKQQQNILAYPSIRANALLRMNG